MTREEFNESMKNILSCDDSFLYSAVFLISGELHNRLLTRNSVQCEYLHNSNMLFCSTSVDNFQKLLNAEPIRSFEPIDINKYLE